MVTELRECVPLILFIIVTSLSLSGCAKTKFQDGNCAKLYSGNNYTDNELEIQEGQPIPDYDLHYVNSDHVWNLTGSLKVMKGCTFISCDESYFDGKCKVFRRDIPTVSAEFSKIGSSNCSCQNECKCKDIQLRKSECARAYMGKGCNSCNTYYMDFRGKKAVVGDAFKGKFSSIIIRPGCTLEVFDEEDFDGESEILEGLKEEWGKEFNSYECTCNSDPVIMESKPRPDNYPPMIEVPYGADGITALLRGHGRHPGLMSALRSVKNKRSPKHAYILMLGLTGAGKSSSINFIFDYPNMTKVGGAISTTSDIHEFRIPIPVDELGISNSELRIIDTPGLGDTRGLENDARFLATLEAYLNGHEDLSKYIPNVILIFAKFNDNRFHGEGANFVKMLRGIDLFRERLTDRKFSNVIFVLSHYISEVIDVVRRPTTRLNLIKKTIEDFTLFPKPITLVVAENKAREQNLPMFNGYFKLPNGDFYPRNLFDKMQLLTTSGEDPIGEAIIRTAFRNPVDFNVSSSTFPMVDSTHDCVLKYLWILSTANFKVNDTEVSRSLATAFESLDPSLKVAFPDALPYLQRAFNIRGINLKSDIPRTAVQVVKFMREIRLNEANVYLMDKAFSLKMPELSENMAVGRGYNLIDDTILTTSPFDLQPKSISDLGYLIPSVLTCQLRNEVKTVYETFLNYGSYVSYQLRNFNVEGSIPADSFKGAVRPGYNVLELLVENATSTENQAFSALREHRLFQLVLNDRPELNKEFIQAVKQLPAFNTSDYDGIEIWKDFFSRYGTHVIKSANGGGSIEIELNSPALTSRSVAQTIFSAVQFADDLNLGLSADIRGLNANGTEYGLKFSGGDFKYHARSLSGMSLTDSGLLLENWRESLIFNPVVLRTDLKILPISEIAKKIGKNITGEIHKAAFALFNSSLKYTPPIKNTALPPPDSRDKINDNSQFTTLVQQLKEESRRANERYETLIKQMKIQMEESVALERNRSIEVNILKCEAQATSEGVRTNDHRNYANWLTGRPNCLSYYEKQQSEHTKELLKIVNETKQAQSELYRQMILAAKSRNITGGCLKSGTKIRTGHGMGDVISVEKIKVGDMVLDMDLIPSRVLSVSSWFLGSQQYFGFDDYTQFFTETHMFKGTNFHVVSKSHLLETNPLVEYLNVTEFPNRQFKMTTYDPKSTSVADQLVTLTMDPTFHPPDTKVYFIFVESKTGTYFANDFVCRHEIPPFEKWPRTMAVLFNSLLDPSARFIKQFEYNQQNLQIVEKVVGEIYEQIENVLHLHLSVTCHKNAINSSGLVLKKFTDFDVNKVMADMFEKDTFGSLMAGIYSTVGPKLAQRLDSGDEVHQKLERVLVKTITEGVAKFGSV